MHEYRGRVVPTVQAVITSSSGRGIGVLELEMLLGAASKAIKKAQVRALSLYLQLMTQKFCRNHC